MNDYFLNQQSGSSESESEHDWPHSRRSSMSSNGWSHYDPTVGESPSSLYEEPASFVNVAQMENYFPSGQLGHIGVVGEGLSPYTADEDQEKILQTQGILEAAAATVKNSVTTSAQDRARGAFVQTWSVSAIDFRE
jgi:hypothetical protein